MVQEIVKDTFFLRLPSEPATRADAGVVQDLLDTLRFHAAHCVGLAANMIGVRKTILVAQVGRKELVMINPEIISHSVASYEAQEGCLSLLGERTAVRWQEITVSYLDLHWKKRQQSFQGFAAQIIQHEMAHFAGTLI